MSSAESKLEVGTLREFQFELLSRVQRSEYPPGRRTQVAVASFLVAHDHCRAIGELLEQGLSASALVLNRALYEAVVKGLWITHCASEARVEAYAGGRELESVKDLIDDLLSPDIPQEIRLSLAKVKQRYWKLLSSFAHAGHAQIKRWLSPAGVEPAYAPEELQEVANFAAFLTLAATWEMARLSNNREALSELSATLSGIAVDGE